MSPDLTLGQVLQDPALVPEELWLLLPKDQTWSTETEVHLVDLDAEDEDPEGVVELDGDTFHQIFANLLQQRSDPSLDDRMRAVDYYLDNDAFIVLDDAV